MRQIRYLIVRRSGREERPIAAYKIRSWATKRLLREYAASVERGEAVRYILYRAAISGGEMEWLYDTSTFVSGAEPQEPSIPGPHVAAQVSESVYSPGAS